MRAAARAVVGLGDQPAQRGEIVLERVDRLRPIRRSGPRERRLRHARRRLLQFAGRWDAARHRAPHLERVERRHARAPLADLQGRERHIEARLRSADGEPQLELFELGAFNLRQQARVEEATRVVEQQRILTRFLWKHALGQSWNEDDVEGTAAELRWARDQHAAVAACGGVGFDGRETVRQDTRRFVEPDGPDRTHRPQIGKDSQDALRPVQHARSECLEMIEPFGPRGLRRPRRKRAHDRQSERRQLAKILDLASEVIDATRARLRSRELDLLQLALFDQPVEAPCPALPARDDARVGEEPFPSPRRTECARIG